MVDATERDARHASVAGLLDQANTGHLPIPLTGPRGAYGPHLAAGAYELDEIGVD